MGRTASRRPTGAVYAPLLGRAVACSVLHVGRLRGTKLEPAVDAEGDPIELPADAGMAELRRRITEPGRYRVEARYPGTMDRLAYSDHDVQPIEDEPESEWGATEPMTERTSRSRSMGEVSEHAYVGHLHDTINNLRDQLREANTRSDRDIRYERERAESALKALQERADAEVRAVQARADVEVKGMQARVDAETRSLRDKCEAAVKQAYDAEVRLAGSAARLEAKSHRVTELESQLAELKEEIDSVRQLAAELKIKADEAGFSPLDAFAHLDKALDLIGSTVERFKDK